MRAVLQRVSTASVAVGDRTIGRIDRGLLALVGVERGDGPADVEYIAGKIRDVRVFEDAADPTRHLNRSVQDIGGSVLVVSQFTLAADCRKGRRPSFDEAAPPELARPLYEDVVRELETSGVSVATGEFQAMMQVSLVNDGPVTVLLDSRKRF
ncbi:MAG TPA: D-aminoacyl-tRNA deacylase [Vicinamibacterales bacterium]|jgi:D-tyrosyl-tRNA(Tyr) deacylase|nr:D-aminoacyl-tRNA deacylase [Vicinamibacterales bacterium]